LIPKVIKKYLLSILRYASLPLAFLYALVIAFRNWLYKRGYSQSLRFTIPIINVGNLSVGGTGKTPHTAYLISLLHPLLQVATLSRGYKRATRGFVLANDSTTAWEIGDEPMQYKMEFPHVEVCVCEDRILAVPLLLQRKPQVKALLLDDAFQHRSIAPSLQILITDYNKLYSRDYILPFGMLREFRSGANRADIIIVSKCPENLQLDNAEKIKQELKLLPSQKIFYSYLKYNSCYSIFTNQEIDIQKKSVVIVSGIANPSPMLDYLRPIVKEFHYLQYRDHHYFAAEDVEEMIEAYSNLNADNKCIITTEKDATRLMLHKEKFIEKKIAVVALPIEIQFLFQQGNEFNTVIVNHIEQFYPDLFAQEEIESRTEEYNH
jgi:tetraacyldisaccharide 4'-kinase